jgi:hypothetical protein
MDKKYEMDDEDETEDIKNNNISINNGMEEKKFPLCDILKTDNFTNNSRNIINEVEHDSQSSSDTEIVDKYNKIIFYHQEKTNNIDSNSEAAEFSGISPLITYNKNKKTKIHKNYNKGENNNYLQRNESFLIPRMNSYNKMYK